MIERHSRQHSAITAWPAHRWIAKAWSRLSWRHIVFALLIYLTVLFLGPNGGTFFFPDPAGKANVVAVILAARYLTLFLPLVFNALVADAAFEDGVPAWVAYGTAWISSAVTGPCIDFAVGWLWGSVRYPSFWSVIILLDGGLFIWGYAYLRTTRHSLRIVQDTEVEQERNRLDIRLAKMMALQARVEPELLFESLVRVGRLHETDASRADAMLDHLIVYLRAMLPGDSVMSTLSRESRLVDAWARVVAHTSPLARTVRQSVPPDLASEPIAPMIVVPLVQAALTDAAVYENALWLDYAVVGRRLQIAVRSSASEITLLDSQTLDQLRQRLAEVYGNRATLETRRSPPCLTLDLPRLTSSPVR